MIVPVSGEQLKRLLPLFNFDFPNRTALVSFLQGNSPGIAVADHAEHPTACIASTNLFNFTYIGGSTPDAEWLAEAIASLRQQRYLTLVGAPWLPKVTLPEPSKILPRYEFLHPQRERQTPPVDLPAGYHFRLLDADLLEHCLWRDEMVPGYGTVDNFFAHALGVCLMHDDQICCEVYALFPAEGHYEIGVVTHEGYRGKGYAHATCTHLAAECARRGFETSWSCDRDNLGSIATARKLGYATQRDYQMYYYARPD